VRSKHLLAIGLAAGLIAIAGCGGGDDDSGDSGSSDTTQQSSPAPPASGDSGEGQQLFASTCGTCHTLEAAGTSGTVGPNLDELKPDQQRVLNAIANGPGVMPANLLQGAQADAVAQYVAENAGK
jgi:cytochrome c6